jgi:hypothetical protein
MQVSSSLPDITCAVWTGKVMADRDGGKLRPVVDINITGGGGGLLSSGMTGAMISIGRPQDKMEEDASKSSLSHEAITEVDRGELMVSPEAMSEEDKVKSMSSLEAMIDKGKSMWSPDNISGPCRISRAAPNGTPKESSE